MKRKWQSITAKAPAVLAVAALLLIWQGVCSLGLVPQYMLPSPAGVALAFARDFGTLLDNAKITLTEAFIGLALGVVIGFVFAVLMDAFDWLYRAVYPILVLTQTVPPVAVAPLLVLWFGYEMTPKVILIVIVTFFPVTVGLLDGFRAVDPDAINLLRSMDADDDRHRSVAEEAEFQDSGFDIEDVADKEDEDVTGDEEPDLDGLDDE